jgi:hypothetical protein
LEDNVKKFSLLSKKYYTSLAIGAFASVFSFVGIDTVSAQVPLRYQKIAGFQTERAFESAAEIVTYDKTGKKLLFMNALAADVTILDMSAPNGTLNVSTSIPLAQYGSAINSIAVYDTLAVAVMENLNPNNPQGTAVFFSTSGRILAQLLVGAQPDMVTFTKDGTKVIVANEGEPRDEYAEDPEGSISIINVAAGLEQNNVTTLLFTDFNLGGSRES